MNLKNKLSVALLIAVGLLVTSPVRAIAGAHFTLTPATGSYSVGQNFSVVMGVDSGTDKVVGIDVKANFDASKLEVVSIEKGTFPSDESYYQFSYTTGQAIIKNDTGSFEVTLSPLNQSIYVGPVAKQELLKVTFRPKATGVASLTYVCSAGSVTETNIISTTGSDVVDCTSNQSGSYTIAAGTGGSTTTTTTTTVATPTVITTASSLPRTGGVFDTLFLMLAGLGSIGGAIYLRKV